VLFNAPQGSIQCQFRRVERLNGLDVQGGQGG
jgi:hypothetical protein